MTSSPRSSRLVLRGLVVASIAMLLAVGLALMSGAAGPARAQEGEPTRVQNLRCITETSRVAFLWDAPEWSGIRASSYDYDLTLPDGRRESGRIKLDTLLYRPGSYQSGKQTTVRVSAIFEDVDGRDVASQEAMLVCTVGGGSHAPSSATPTPTPTPTATPTPVRDGGNDYADLVDQLYQWRDDPQLVAYKSHTDRWDRALLAFGETVADASLKPMTAEEAQGFVDRGWSRWEDVTEALRDIESSGGKEPVQAPTTTPTPTPSPSATPTPSPTPTATPSPVQGGWDDYAALIAQVYQWRNDPRYASDRAHTDRWDRVLQAFGETVANSALTPMTMYEARDYVNRGWNRWADVFKALRDIKAREFIEREVVEKHEETHPWLRETWDGMRRAGVSVRVLPIPSGSAADAAIVCRYAECRVTGLTVNPAHADSRTTYIHELAHVWTIDSRVTSAPTGEIGMGYVYFDHLRKVHNCTAPVRELYADVITLLVWGDRYFNDRISHYLGLCHPALPLPQAKTVASSVLNKQTPQWFTDRYQNDDGTWKLDEIWAAVKDLPPWEQRYAAFHFGDSSAFGGYCPNVNVLRELSNQSGISNPWRNGGCINAVP